MVEVPARDQPRACRAAKRGTRGLHSSTRARPRHSLQLLHFTSILSWPVSSYTARWVSAPNILSDSRAKSRSARSPLTSSNMAATSGRPWEAASTRPAQLPSISTLTNALPGGAISGAQASPTYRTGSIRDRDSSIYTAQSQSARKLCPFIPHLSVICAVLSFSTCEDCTSFNCTRNSCFDRERSVPCRLTVR